MDPKDRRERHLIIGAGFSGLAAAKAFRQAGIDYDQVEMDDAIGGNWYHGVYDSTHIISSRKGTEYSDFPMPEDYPDFPSRDQLLAYFNAYADHFGLRGRIEFETEVRWVEPLSPDGMGGWRVTLDNGDVRDYEGVVVANGHHWKRRVPEFPGTYSGKTLHSKDYKRPSDLEGKRIVVVGAGNSACDVAVEAADEGFETYISIRRGTHFLPKTIFGVPTDQFDRWWMPVSVQKRLLKVLLALAVGSNERYGLPKPEHDLFDRHPTVNSQLLYALKHGRIGVRPNIARLDGKRVEFVDGTGLDDVDTIVYATGFQVAFPFLDDHLLDWGDGGRYPVLSGQLMPPGYGNLYIWGVGQPRGGAGPLLTAGSRLMARIVQLQRGIDRPVGNELAKLRRPEARELFGVSEMMRLIKTGNLGLWLIERGLTRWLPPLGDVLPRPLRDRLPAWVPPGGPGPRRADLRPSTAISVPPPAPNMAANGRPVETAKKREGARD